MRPIRSVRLALAAATLLPLAVALTPAHAAAPPIVATVVDVVEMRAEPEQRWAFTRTMTLGDQTLVARFDPSRAPDEAWTLVAPASADALGEELEPVFESFGEDVEADLDLMLGVDDPEDDDTFAAFTARLGEALQVICEDAAEAVFTFAPTGDLMLGGGGDDQDDIARHLSGEVVIAKAQDPADEPMLASLRYFAERSFKANMMARIAAFDLTLHFGEIEPDGPIAIVGTDTHIAGRALFQGFEQTIRIENTDFARVDAHPQATP